MVGFGEGTDVGKLEGTGVGSADGCGDGGEGVVGKQRPRGVEAETTTFGCEPWMPIEYIESVVTSLTKSDGSPLRCA